MTGRRSTGRGLTFGSSPPAGRWVGALARARERGYLQRMQAIWTWAACLVAAAVCGGCGVIPGASTPSPSASPSPCQPAVETVVQAVRGYVAAYENPASTGSPASSEPSRAAPGSPEAAAITLDAAVVTARQAVTDGCPRAELLDRLARELAEVTADGAVARAVLLRLTANLTGTIGTDPRVTIGPADDLHRVVAEAAPGAIVELAAGEYRLAETLVLLDAVTLAGEGRDRTRLRSSATEAAVLVMTAGLVGFRSLSLERDPLVPGSGIITGGVSAVRLEDVEVSGAQPGEQGRGGAGIDLAGSGTATEPEATTLEVTDSTFTGNGWAGISVAGGHRVSVESTTFDDNAECGICFLGAAGGSVQASRFSGNGVGVAAIGTSTPVIRGNTFSGGEVGVQIGDGAQPTLDDNRISTAERAAVIYTDTAAGVLRATVCSDVPVGIVLAKTALPSLIDNDCTVVRSG